MSAAKKRAAAKRKRVAKDVPNVWGVIATWQESRKSKPTFGFVVSTHAKLPDARDACAAEHDAAYALVMGVPKGTLPGARVSIADVPSEEVAAAQEAP